MGQVEWIEVYPVLRLVSLMLILLIGARCSPAPGNESGGQQPSSTQNEHSVAAQHNGADAIAVSSFVGEKPNLVMLVRWLEFGSAKIEGEMRVTEVAGRDSADRPESTQLNTHKSHFKGTRDRSTVFLDLSPQNPGAPSGAWVGELVEAPESTNTEGPALRLRDPDGNQILLSEGTDRDYADAVARLAEECCEGTSGQS